MATWILSMHALDMYWFIMPNVSPLGIHLQLLDLTCFVGIGGIFVGTLFNRMKRHSLYPNGDPRVEDSIHHKIV